MIDSLVKLAEKIGEWAKYRNERKEVRFKRLVEPSFEAMKAVHSDYLSFLEECLRAMKRGDPLKSVYETILVRRVEEEAERRAIQHQASTIYHDKSFAEFHNFYYEVEHYFELGPFGVGTASSILSSRLRHAAEAESSVIVSPSRRAPAEATREDLIQSFEGILEFLRERWNQVAAAYAGCLNKSIS